MEEQTKKWLSIAFAVVALIVAGIVISKTFSGGSGSGGGVNAKVYLLCKSCGEMEVTKDEFREIRVNQPVLMNPMVGGPMLVNCPKCGKKTCAVATKCQGCGNVYVVVPKPGSTEPPDKCPKCGYSAIEERRKKMSNL